MERKIVRKINIVTLGCSKNLVDSERLAARAAAAGYEIVFDSNDADAEVVVVNTCGFIGDAKQESIDTILGFVRARKRRRIEKLYVIGCLSERYADELRAEIPEVDRYFGARTLDGILSELENLAAADEFALSMEEERDHDIAESEGDANRRSCGVLRPAAQVRSASRSHRPNESDSIVPTRLVSTPPHYAYLKISEGCDRRCGFCAIPLIRGPHRSTPVEELVKEAEELAAQGVKELIVIAQDTTWYGLDLYGERRLGGLLERLARIEKLEWIRLHYAYPAGFPDDVIEVMRREPKICKYLDIPLQHIAEGQLSAMKRGLGSAGTRALIEKLRAQIPGLAIRTTMLVGHPGETEADFEELLEFAREQRFERLGVFPYSAEEGTYSADNLIDDVPDEVKERRAERLMELQAEVSAELNATRVGSVERVIVDRLENAPGGLPQLVCRSERDSPEVDCEVLVPLADAAVPAAPRPGDMIDVLITGSSEYDLWGGVV